MPERRRDWQTGEWVVIAGDRASRPIDVALCPEPSLPGGTRVCPFCAGNEHETTPPLAEYDAHGRPRASGRWQVRVVPNMYPAFDGSATCDSGADPKLVHRAGIATDTSTGRFGPLNRSLGRHEVLIESPRHLRRLSELSTEQVERIFCVYRDRLRSAREQGGCRYGLVFKNCGVAAGMSREHIHSQLVALPFVPQRVRAKERRMRRFYRLRNGCLICRILARQRVDSARRVMDTPQLVAYCPFASSFPYEVWITPRKHLAAFDRSDDSLVAAAGQLVQTILMRLEDQVPGIAYNYVIDTIPFDRTDDGHYHWHIRIMPRMARLAGLELATGVHVNIVPPEQAAARLRGG